VIADVDGGGFLDEEELRRVFATWLPTRGYRAERVAADMEGRPSFYTFIHRSCMHSPCKQERR
jgi:hypothetical protein